MELYDWMKQVLDAGAEKAKRNISIVVIDEAGNDTVRWSVLRAWPVKYKISDLQARSDEVLIESLEIAHEGLVWAT